MSAKDCNTIKELMEYWKNKPEKKTSYTADKKEQIITINHEKNFFIPDGIVDEAVWASLPEGKRVLLVLKEAYEKEKEKQEWSLNDELREYGPWGSIWNRVSEWSYGIAESSEEKIAPYKHLNEEANGYLRKIAVMNIKKSDGKPTSVREEISAYAKEDGEEILREIELIDPDIIICGYTFDDINYISGETMKKVKNENWYYYSDAIGGKERLFIDYYHPANHYPALLNYYGVVGIYQQALIISK